MENDLLVRIDDYIESLFGGDDTALLQNITDANTAGLPPIQVSANQGRLLYLLAKLSGPQRILEIGSLGGYSTTWLARALPIGGTVVTLEVNPHHAAVARRNLERAGVASQVTIEIGAAADTLRAFIERRESPFDFVFIDADKVSYPVYLDLALQLSRAGTVIVADNLIRNGAVIDEAPADENARAAKAFNAKIAAHPRLESTILPIMRQSIDGMSISIVKF
jgi:predicted O-methyltransferase YrrM